MITSPLTLSRLLIVPGRLLWFALLRLWYMRENRRRDRLQGDKPVDHNADFSNLTDCENLSFRYQL